MYSFFRIAVALCLVFAWGVLAEGPVALRSLHPKPTEAEFIHVDDENPIGEGSSWRVYPTSFVPLSDARLVPQKYAELYRTLRDIFAELRPASRPLELVAKVSKFELRDVGEQEVARHKALQSTHHLPSRLVFPLLTSLNGPCTDDGMNRYKCPYLIFEMGGPPVGLCLLNQRLVKDTASGLMKSVRSDCFYSADFERNVEQFESVFRNFIRALSELHAYNVIHGGLSESKTLFESVLFVDSKFHNPNPELGLRFINFDRISTGAAVFPLRKAQETANALSVLCTEVPNIVALKAKSDCIRNVCTQAQLKLSQVRLQLLSAHRMEDDLLKLCPETPAVQAARQAMEAEQKKAQADERARLQAIAERQARLRDQAVAARVQHARAAADDVVRKNAAAVARLAQLRADDPSIRRAVHGPDLMQCLVDARHCFHSSDPALFEGVMIGVVKTLSQLHSEGIFHGALKDGIFFVDTRMPDPDPRRGFYLKNFGAASAAGADASEWVKALETAIAVKRLCGVPSMQVLLKAHSSKCVDALCARSSNDALGAVVRLESVGAKLQADPPTALASDYEQSLLALCPQTPFPPPLLASRSAGALEVHAAVPAPLAASASAPVLQAASVLLPAFPSSAGVSPPTPSKRVLPAAVSSSTFVPGVGEFARVMTH